ncbi:class I SAM-dependent methyltransferase [Desulfovibrio sp. OttesenSCG-928-M16]|nr:class I SAM-dependent methyltransferase [Desulfovibrio sp. OttesenSCG-928-M16]
MDFSLVKVIPEGVHSSNCFDDIILPLYYAFSRLGYKVETRVNSLNPHSRNIFFGTCQMPGLSLDTLPADSIIFNLEQLTSPSCPWNNSHYVAQLRRFAVWDYSPRNVRYLHKSLGLEHVEYLPLGYVPEMTRLRTSFSQDIDVLFYGAINERRKQVLEQLNSAGLRVGILHGAYGTERDHAIARAKCILNIHYYVPATLELPRLGYLLANSKAVVSERRPETEIPAGLDAACAYAPYEELLPTVRSLVQDKKARTEQAEAGFTAFAALKQEDFLEVLVGRKKFASATLPLPRQLHAGSGKDFRKDCLNVDINPRMNPDMLLDLSLPLDPTVRHKTLRFGDIRLMPGKFDRITAFEILEHVNDLPQTMRNFLDLLADGGELELSVPYELSCGAWQDPTHVRAFNESSWLYYTNWAWYIGWKNTRFDLQSLEYTLSSHGESLKRQGAPLEEIIRTPRAVDGMHVLLRKRKSTPQEKEEYDRMTRSFYEGAVGEWSI